jgi:tRNA-specific 2-thiouridylase
LGRALRLGFDAIATGHHARVTADRDSGRVELRRGADVSKDQSYVLSVLTAEQLERVLLPVGTMQKSDVRRYASTAGLLTADKAESQDVCFIASRTGGQGRSGFLSERIALHPGSVVDKTSGAELGAVPAVELVTIGQRRGLGVSSGPEPSYVVDVDVKRRVVTVGRNEDLLIDEVLLIDRTWVDAPLPSGAFVGIQVSAHGAVRDGRVTDRGVSFSAPERRVAPGQIVACYVDDRVVGSGVAA